MRGGLLKGPIDALADQVPDPVLRAAIKVGLRDAGRRACSWVCAWKGHTAGCRQRNPTAMHNHRQETCPQGPLACTCLTRAPAPGKRWTSCPQRQGATQ